MIEKYVGCSGYYYNHWKTIFYPEELPKNKWIPFYAEHFNTVEINSSFYHIPQDSTLSNWYNITPSNFVFTLKGYRFITHLKKLHMDAILMNMISEFERKAFLLKDKLGCVLWQLPVSQGKDVEKLEHFCKSLNTDIKHVFEFRHVSWFTKEVYDILTHFKCSLCIISAPDNLPEHVYTTSDIAYLRFHGKNGWYDDNYSEEELEKWVEKLKPLTANQLYAYFNNDFHGFAIQNGLYFSKIVNIL